VLCFGSGSRFALRIAATDVIAGLELDRRNKAIEDPGEFSTLKRMLRASY
jgi:hypothetical protein